MIGRRHLIQDRYVEMWLGVALLFAGAYLIHDATDRRGVETPRLLRPFTFL